MAGWIFQWISSVRARFRQHVDLVLELIVVASENPVHLTRGHRRIGT
jgi:hypothetical protein